MSTLDFDIKLKNIDFITGVKLMIIINEGDGKGKTTAAIGQAVRAKGQGMKVKIIQLIKSGQSGELEMLRKLGITVDQYGLGFTDKGDKEMHKMAVERGIQAINKAIDSNDVEMIICDEINYAVSGNLVDEESVLKLIDKAHEKKVHLVMTGRGPTEKMIEAADIVTNMVKIKHAFDSGIKAQPGIEY